LVYEVSTVFGDMPLNAGQCGRRFALEHAYLSKRRHETTDCSGLRVVHDTGIAVQELSHYERV
jgi:hypothetical protein